MYVLIDLWTSGFFFDSLTVVSILAVLLGVSVIIVKNPIVSVLFLIGLFFSIACYLMILGLNFIGLSYLLVYVGAVSILFLFILMLINVRISELVTDNSNSFILGILTATFIYVPLNVRGLGYQFDITRSVMVNKQELINSPFYSNTNQSININNTESNLIYDIFQSFNADFKERMFYVTSNIWDGALAEISHITAIGNVIYTSYPLWLILTSVILLLAMVGAIIITIKQ